MLLSHCSSPFDLSHSLRCILKLESPSDVKLRTAVYFSVMSVDYSEAKMPNWAICWVLFDDA